MKQPILIAVALSVAISSWAKDSKTMEHFFLPITPQSELVTEGSWGESVLPRDTCNGLEDGDLDKWCYWDGSIVKDDEGLYHMYSSRWTQGVHHSQGWHFFTHGVHAVSKTLLGKYVDQGAMWPDENNGLGHNVVGIRMADGRYAAISSEVCPGTIYVSENPYGPFKKLGTIEVEHNGYYDGWAAYNELDEGAVKGNGIGRMANVMIIVRPDGRYMLCARHCSPMISDNGILGPYKMMGERAWWGVEGMPQFKNEDPTFWYSDGMYHIVVNHYKKDTPYHLTSEDGLDNWKFRGKAFDKAKNFVYTNGINNPWYTCQRPTVYVEDGEIKAFNFSVIDVHKGRDGSNDKHGSKIMVVPFDGKKFGEHIRKIVDDEDKVSDKTPAPAPWKATQIGKVKGNSGYDKIVNTIRMKSAASTFGGKSDSGQFTYQKMEGDVSFTTKILSFTDNCKDVVAGLMFRSSLEGGSAAFGAVINSEDGFSLQYRSQEGGDMESLKSIAEVKAPYWIRVEKRGDKITTYISSSNHHNWKKVSTDKIELSKEFYVGLYSSSKSADLASGVVRFKDSDLHKWGEPVREGIVSHTFPDTIYSTVTSVDFEIEVETERTLEVWAELENIQTKEKHAVLRQVVPDKGVVKLTYNLGKQLSTQSSYWFVIKAVPLHFHDSEAIQSSFKKVYVVRPPRKGTPASGQLKKILEQ